MRSLRAMLTALALVALVLVAAAPVSASGAATYRPDARIRFVCAGVVEWRMCEPKLVGDNVYNTTAQGQKKVWNDYFDYATEPDPRRMAFRISLQNDGRVADRFKVNADGVTRGYSVRFFHGTKNITSAVEAGTYVTPLIAAGKAFVITAKVAMNCAPTQDCGQDRASRLVTVRSWNNPALVDAVRFIRMRWICTC